MNPNDDLRSGALNRAVFSRTASRHIGPRNLVIAAVFVAALVAVAGTATGTSENSAPGAPAGVTASRGTTGTVAVVTWQTASASSGVVSYRVWRAEDRSGFSPVASVRGATYTDRAGVPGSSYRYQVTACTARGAESLPSAATATITVEWTVSPHARPRSSAQITNYCGICHVPHASDTTDAALRPSILDRTATSICSRCHDGSGAVTNITSGPVDSFALASGHTLEGVGEAGGDLTDSCDGCHHVHGDAASQTALKPASITGPVIGTRTVGAGANAWCFACHDDRGSWYAQKFGAPYPSRASGARDPQGYPLSGTFPGPGVYGDEAANEHAAIPASADAGMDRGDCLFCHAAHRGVSRYDGLRASYRPSDPRTLADDQASGAYAALCFICHGGSRPSYLATVPVDVKRYVTSGSRNAGHRVISDGAALPFGSPLPCYDCHDPHGSRASAFGLEVRTATGPGAPTVIGDSAGEIVMGPGATATDVRRFCLSCHTTSDTGKGWNGSAMAPVSAGALVEGVDRVSFDGVLRLPDQSAHCEVDPRSCYDCHGGSYETADSFNVHNPNPGRPTGEAQCDTCHDTASTVAPGSESETPSEPGGPAVESVPSTDVSGPDL